VHQPYFQKTLKDSFFWVSASDLMAQQESAESSRSRLAEAGGVLLLPYQRQQVGTKQKNSLLQEPTVGQQAEEFAFTRVNRWAASRKFPITRIISWAASRRFPITRVNLVGQQT
jgi:hypothetical protein